MKHKNAENLTVTPTPCRCPPGVTRINYTGVVGRGAKRRRGRAGKGLGQGQQLETPVGDAGRMPLMGLPDKDWGPSEEGRARRGEDPGRVKRTAGARTTLQTWKSKVEQLA